MNKKIVGILIITLFMVTAIFPASAFSMSVNENLYEQEEAELFEDPGLVVCFMFGLLNGYRELDEYDVFDYKIGFWFIFGFYNGPLLGPAIITGEIAVDKGLFIGTLTQSHIFGCLIVAYP